MINDFENDIKEEFFTLEEAFFHIPQIAPSYLVRRAKAKKAYKIYKNVEYIKKDFIFHLKTKIIGNYAK